MTLKEFNQLSKKQQNAERKKLKETVCCCFSYGEKEFICEKCKKAI